MPYNPHPHPTLPVVMQKEKEAYQFWLALHRNFPKTERFSLGQKIEQSFLAVLELTFIAAYLPPEQKIILLGKTKSRLDVLKFFVLKSASTLSQFANRRTEKFSNDDFQQS